MKEECLICKAPFQKIILSTYSQWEVTKLKVFFKNFFSHLFPVCEAIYQGVFEKTSKILLLRGNPFIAPSLTPCLKAIL